jgi:5,10-methylenetetrahydrofolate reductase
MVESFINKLHSGNFLSLEVTPPHAPSLDNIIENIKKFNLDSVVDGFSTTDNPLARLKYDSMFSALKLQQTFKKACITTMSMRDRNKIALQSDLLGMNDFDLRIVLALTGDPARSSDQPNAKAVNEGRSTLLLDMIKCFNSGIDYSGKPFKIAPKKIFPLCVTNAYAKSNKTIYKNLRLKLSHGTSAIITQPVYDKENAKMLLDTFNEAKKETEFLENDPVMILGFFPITRLRTAQFLNSHVPGIHVPSLWMEKLLIAKEKSPEDEFKVGLELSKKAFDDIHKIGKRVHLMSANHFELIKQILESSI